MNQSFTNSHFFITSTVFLPCFNKDMDLFAFPLKILLKFGTRPNGIMYLRSVILINRLIVERTSVQICPSQVGCCIHSEAEVLGINEMSCNIHMTIVTNIPFFFFTLVRHNIRLKKMSTPHLCAMLIEINAVHHKY